MAICYSKPNNISKNKLKNILFLLKYLYSKFIAFQIYIKFLDLPIGNNNQVYLLVWTENEKD